MSDKYFNTFEMYKIAIEGRNEHYKNYNTWVNLYSIFTGALFVRLGLYRILCKLKKMVESQNKNITKGDSTYARF